MDISPADLEFYGTIFVAAYALLQVLATRANLVAPLSPVTKVLVFLANMLPADIRPYLKKLFPVRDAQAKVAVAAEAVQKLPAGPLSVAPSTQVAATAAVVLASELPTAKPQPANDGSGA